MMRVFLQAAGLYGLAKRLSEWLYRLDHECLVPGCPTCDKKRRYPR